MNLRRPSVMWVRQGLPFGHSAHRCDSGAGGEIHRDVGQRDDILDRLDRLASELSAQRGRRVEQMQHIASQLQLLAQRCQVNGTLPNCACRSEMAPVANVTAFHCAMA